MNRLVPILLIAAAVVFGYAPFLIRDSPAEDTMGVVFAKPDKNDRIIAVARNPASS